jgi:hypothetical protein
MALILAASINLNEIPKDKIIIGKKGKYLPISITLNDELDQFGNQLYRRAKKNAKRNKPKHI